MPPGAGDPGRGPVPRGGTERLWRGLWGRARPSPTPQHRRFPLPFPSLPGGSSFPPPPGATWHLQGDGAGNKMADEKDNGEGLQEIQKKIKEAFEVFDHESNDTVDVREIGTIIRSLGCCPSEGELHDLIAEVEEEEPSGYIRLEKFLPMMVTVLLERRYRPIPEDLLLQAFEVLDTGKMGFLTKEELVKYMTEEGEPFTQEEMEEMLSAALDPETNIIQYKDYLAMMVIDEN
ncbi:dynein regulatory complex protein 8 isoform X1 [Macrotis lagotis]|uniref:dynein regulatory complex protein 8 isoform X1 n=1 Tax=Macrotis lagotis TaxID=92651 RepID=UPI003D69DA82